MKFLYSLVTLLGGVAAQSIILDDLNQKISPQVTKLADDVQGFPGSGLDGALTIDSDSKDLVTILDSATEDARNQGSYSQVTGVTLTADISPVVITLNDLLSGLSAKKDDFNALALPAGSLILSDLQKLNQSTVDYANALVDAAPVLQVVAMIAIRDTIAASFEQAIDTYTP
ncbi:hydrophobic surface binding protein A-domain-containing protein [Aspergillus novoparasiticus]|uniref:Hydrophobic surface binding protein A-domain-containing protein n=1 Tax=Aspergillus novoparasiticus TaxID=986946 RepID=A0A5N6F571_9EURO|nr:hydrophobic surface binding protein A-domain-containing protein [Aspergillus novoparasiticus]